MTKSKKLQGLISEALSAVTCWDRARRYCEIDPSGMPGVRRVREIQTRMRAVLRNRDIRTGALTLLATPRANRYRARMATPRANRWTEMERWSLRAKATGDMEIALDLARSYHTNIDDIYQSKYGDVLWGGGGQELSSSSIYRGAYKGWRHSWKNAGVYVDYSVGSVVVIENSRGCEVARIDIGGKKRPPSNAIYSNTIYISDVLLDGDLFAVPNKRKRGGRIVYRRYGLVRDNGVIVQTGYAVECRENDTKWCEHGRTLAQIDAEIEHKRRVREAERKADRLSQSERDRLERKARLIAHLCGRLLVTYEHARAVGYCVAGIEKFARRHGMDTSQGVPVSVLRATADARVERPIYEAAQQLALMAAN